MIVKIKIMLAVLAAILITAIAFASPSHPSNDLRLNHAAGCGTADYTKVEIIRVVDSEDTAADNTTTINLPITNVSGEQEIRVAVYWCNIPYNLGMGPTSITNVELNITDNAGHTITGYPVSENSPLNVSGQQITNGHNHYVSIYKFIWDTKNVVNGAYKLTPKVNFQFNYNNKFEIGETVLVSVENVAESVTTVIVFMPKVDNGKGNSISGKFDTSQVLKVFNNPTGIGPNPNINLVFNDTEEDVAVYHPEDKTARFISASTMKKYGYDYSTYYITLRNNQNDETMPYRGLTLLHPELGFCPDSSISYAYGDAYTSATPSKVNTMIITYETVMSILSSPEEYGDVEVNVLITNSISNTVAHEIGHAIGIFNECPDVLCFMHSPPNEDLIYNNMLSYDVWNSTDTTNHQYSDHESEIRTRLKLD